MPGGTRALARLGLGLVLALAACAEAADDGRERVRLGGRSFRLELADDPESRRVGLMHRSTLPADGGMLFVFPDARPRSFWMGHCRMDLDVIFLDSAGRITALHAMREEPPQRPDESDVAYQQRMPDYPSGRAARYAIELAGGSLPALGLRVGDRVDLDHARLVARAR